MNEDDQHNIPLDVITKGRTIDAVLAEYMRVWGEIQEAATEPWKSPDEIFADTMEIATYRIYLLGVQDGMEEARHDR